MSLIPPDAVGMLSGGGIVGGLAALVTTIGWWLRRERVESSKADNVVAANNASTNTYEAQSKELASLRERLSQIESAYVAQAAQMGILMRRISELEARLVGISAHYDNLILCDVCLATNTKVLDALDKKLRVDNENQ